MLLGTDNINYPVSLSDITLGQWIDFYKMYGKDLDQRLQEINNLEDELKKNLEMSYWNMDYAYCTVAFFAGIELKNAHNRYYVPDVMSVYSQFPNIYDVETLDTYLFNYDIWTIPSPTLSPKSNIAFAEFIDAKIITQNAQQNDLSNWELLQYICAIFFRRKDEKYKEEYVDEESERFQMMRNLHMHTAMAVWKFFDSLNNFCKDHFSVFNDSGEAAGRYAAAHFEKWGWVNFLKQIAKTKVFDIPNSGMNSIDCARAANAYEVLVYASEEKDYNNAINADMEARLKT